MLSPATRAALARHLDDVRNVFADALAARLGRTADEVRVEGLEAGDFRSDEGVNVTLCDGSTMSFRYAFAVVDPTQRLVGIFTEHCGYFCLPMADLRLDELRDGAVVRRHAW